MAILLTDILKEVLLEAKPPKYPSTAHRGRDERPIKPSVKEAIKNCIENRWLLQFYYIGDSEQAPGSRKVEPYLWGIRKETGTEQLRAWQFEGKTVSYNPGWATFRLDRITATAPMTSRTFDHARPLYNPDDKMMSKIIMRVQLPGSGPVRPTAPPANTPKPPSGVRPNVQKGIDKSKNAVSRLRNRLKEDNDNS
jgi:predicted DNA-binding transcriptional regulator YafY